MSEALARRLTDNEVVSVYTRAVEKIRKGYQEISEAEKLLNDTFVMQGSGAISAFGHGARVSFGSDEPDLIAMRHDVWRMLIERLGVRRMMSVRRCKELDRMIERREMPEISHQSVRELVGSFEASLPQMLAEAVEEVFNWLRPPGSEYKTNTELEVGPKVVLTSVVEKWGKFCSSWRVNYHRNDELTALENVFTALDGRGQILKNHYSQIAIAINTPGFAGVGETPYFKFKAFKNGNLHLEFKRLDLLSHFNAIAGGRRLRPASPAEEAVA